jgi:TetR/AcrR family transcriptional regulator, tetracycline repressor protein
MPTKGSRATSAAKRVPRNTLSRARVIDGALALIDTDGLDAVTMPRLAKHLGVGTMSLYRHVDDKNDLINAVAERVLGDVQVPDGQDDDWEGRVVGYLRALRDAALAHPALARILAERGLTVGPVFEQLEQAHTVLRRAGFSELRAVRTFYALFTYVFGFVIWELPRVHEQPATSYVDSWNTAIDRLDADSYPTMHELRDELTTAASREQFEFGLDRLMESLRPRS